MPEGSSVYHWLGNGLFLSPSFVSSKDKLFYTLFIFRRDVSTVIRNLVFHLLNIGVK